MTTADDVATPARERLRWLLDALADPRRVTLADLEAVYDTREWGPGWDLHRELEEMHNDVPALAGATVVAVDDVSTYECSATLERADGKRWLVTCWASEEPPHKLVDSRVVPAPPPGTIIRDATPADAAALAELERRSPLRLGDTLVLFDRGADYFASARLMEDVTIYLAEVDGGVAGVYWGAKQHVRVQGQDRQLFLEHHVRIDPTTPRGGVFWALVVYGRDRYARSTDSIAFYVSPENHAVRKFVEGVPPWSVQAFRALLPCPLPDRGAGSAALVEPDLDAVAGALNECHGRSELFVPYDRSSLVRRLARDPEQYGVDRLLATPGAAVGVGRDLLRVTRERGDERTETVRAHALDHGFAPRHENEYRLLLDAWCTQLATEGATHLAVFTSPASPTYPVLTDLAVALEPFDFWAFAIDEPPDLASRGLYVDPVYF